MIVALDGGRTAGLGRVDQCTEVLATFDDALDEMVSALREYTDDWSDHLLHAPNHAELSTDEQLRSWLQQ